LNRCSVWSAVAPAVLWLVVSLFLLFNSVPIALHYGIAALLAVVNVLIPRPAMHDRSRLFVAAFGAFDAFGVVGYHGKMV
jgi:Gpi18-like mannosyltransferase